MRLIKKVLSIRVVLLRNVSLVIYNFFIFDPQKTDINAQFLYKNSFENAKTNFFYIFFLSIRRENDCSASIYLTELL